VESDRRASAEAAPKAATSQTGRVNTEKLDSIMDVVGELVFVQSQLIESARALGDTGSPLGRNVAQLGRITKELQRTAMALRMIPIKPTFQKMERLVRDLARDFDKKVSFVTEGEDTELDRTVVDALGDPLVHLVRNSLDHGLEGPEERAAAGKPATGVLEISAQHAGGNVVITVSDDGRGIDPQRVAVKAAERGLIAPEVVESIDMARAVELLFSPGFSTAEVTSDISGRGVGMDAVRAAIRGLGGEVLMTSELGRGTTAQIRLPLTLAIMAALIVEADGRPFAIPLDRIERTVRVSDQTIRSVAGRRMLVLTDGVLPIVDASERYGGGPLPEAEYAVVVRGGNERFALTVSRLVGQHELVTRPLPPEIAEGSALSGAAVLSNGQIALIVDCDAVVDVPVSA
jgi:two-component system chemotaxis sensor kinase CheA